MDVFQAIFDRRSIRKYLDRPVEEEKILKILDAARWAPSIGNLQDWQFVVVREKGRKIQLSEAALGQYWLANAPIVIVVCSKIKRLTRIYGDLGEQVYSIMDCSIAMQNIMLAAHAQRLSSTLIATFDENSVKRILKIPEGIRVYGMVPIGYPAEKPNPPHRMGLEHNVFFENYGKTWSTDVPRSVRPVFLRRDEPFIG